MRTAATSASLKWRDAVITLGAGARDCAGRCVFTAYALPEANFNGANLNSANSNASSGNGADGSISNRNVGGMADKTGHRGAISGSGSGSRAEAISGSSSSVFKLNLADAASSAVMTTACGVQAAAAAAAAALDGAGGAVTASWSQAGEAVELNELQTKTQYRQVHYVYHCQSVLIM